MLLAQDADHRELADPRAWHAVIGVSHLLRDDLRLGLEAYHKWTDRLPVDPRQPGLLPIDELFYGYGFLTARDTLAATGAAHTTGLELLIQKRLTDRFYGLVGASLFRWNAETGRETPIRQWGRLPVFGFEWAF